MTIDETLVTEVDQVVGALATTRAAFIRQALERALRAYRLLRLEELDEQGYQIRPASPADVEEWEGEQEWGDAWNEEKE